METKRTHGLRKGSLGPPWILKFAAKKGCFLSFKWEKSVFTTFAPPGKILEKSPNGLCQITWNYFQLQQNCLHDVLNRGESKPERPGTPFR